jgi:Diguanylate cyclase, GGDEF domain
LFGNFREPTLTQNIELDLFDYVVAEIAVVDGAGAVVHFNRKWEETSKTGGLLPKQPGWNYIAECEAAIQRGCNVAEILAGLRAVLQGETPSFVATYACPFNGLYHWYQVLISVVEIKGTRHAILMHVDVSAMQRDALTGLPNRAMFDAQLHLALSLAKETGSRTGIVVVDMNNLKFLNDKHGHYIGDEALKGLALELKHAGHVSASYRVSSMSRSLSIQCCTFIDVLGQVKRKAGIGLDTVSRLPRS